MRQLIASFASQPHPAMKLRALVPIGGLLALAACGSSPTLPEPSSGTPTVPIPSPARFDYPVIPNP